MGAPVPSLSPGRPGFSFGAQKGRPTNVFLLRNRSPRRFLCFLLRGEWFVCRARSVWMYQFPSTPSSEGFYRDFLQTQKNPWAPWGPGWLPSVPLWANGPCVYELAWTCWALERQFGFARITEEIKSDHWMLVGASQCHPVSSGTTTERLYADTLQSSVLEIQSSVTCSTA